MMTDQNLSQTQEAVSAHFKLTGIDDVPRWVTNGTILWQNRIKLAKVFCIAAVLSLGVAFSIPKEYQATASIMPPDSASPGAAIFAALAGHALSGSGGLGSLAGSLLGGRTSSSLFVDLLHSGTVSGHLIDRFQLQHVYHKRYRIEAAKYLARHTTIVDDKKSGVISITVEDQDPQRARDLAQAYLDELNHLVVQTNTSSARQERLFIERRLKGVQADLETAQQELGEFSSTHSTIDIKEQTRAMVDAAAKLEAQEIVGESELESLRQIYGNGNVRVRAADARIAVLRAQLSKMSGSSAPLDSSLEGESNSQSAGSTELYPPLRQLPRLAVPYADIYRRVRVQETLFELLTQQYEMTRIEEAKDVPVVSVIDAPTIPEKKSFPPRLIVAALLTLFATTCSAAMMIARRSWDAISNHDPRKALVHEIYDTTSMQMLHLSQRRNKG